MEKKYVDNNEMRESFVSVSEEKHRHASGHVCDLYHVPLNQSGGKGKVPVKITEFRVGFLSHFWHVKWTRKVARRMRVLSCATKLDISRKLQFARAWGFPL